MPVILCHNSALEYYRNSSDCFAGAYIPAPEYLTPSEAEAKEALNAAPTQHDINELLCRNAETLSDPLHLAIKTNRQRPRHSTAIFHTLPKDLRCTSLKKTCASIGSSALYLCNVPLLLSQLSLDKSYGEIAAIGYELCGLYRLSNKVEDSTQTGLIKTDPLCSVRSISAYVRRNPSTRGAKRLGFVAQYMCDNSASPMETMLSILLCFPTKWGGYGLPKPKLNKRIPIPRSAQIVTNKHYFVCDMVWPKKMLVIEYDSNQFHTGADFISKDALKRNVLSDLGYSVVTVTSDQVFNAIKTHELAKQISKHLGIRFRGAKAEPNSSRFTLREELIQANFRS